MKSLVIDISKCSGCYCCQIVCKDEHVGNDWTPYAKPQPDTGQFWMKIHEHVRGTIPKVKMAYVPVLCQHCEDAPCIAACPRDALTQSEKNGTILVEEDKCNGCGWCIEACDYGAIMLHPEKKVVFVCDMCEGEPKCVEWCPEEALDFVTKDTLAQKARITAVKKLFQEALKPLGQTTD